MPAFLLALSAHAAVTWSRLTEAWPDNSVLREAPGIAVSWPSSSPFAPEHIGADPEENPPTAASGRLFLPPGNHPPRSVPAIVLLHGSGGVLSMRELTYAAQLASMGVPLSLSIRSRRGASAAPSFWSAS